MQAWIIPEILNLQSFFLTAIWTEANLLLIYWKYSMKCGEWNFTENISLKLVQIMGKMLKMLSLLFLVFSEI
jgi:hypothetical protein